uniref:Carboxylic ester hydrolase n=1 Tax=Romanomermis culicivorax TaxID=13658 RepID=A0A915I429_ROMCU
MLLIFVFPIFYPPLRCTIVGKVNTKLGSVNGLHYTTPKGNKGEKYLGLPYAEKPVGRYRFEYPIPLKRWPQQPYNATYKRSVCLQQGAGDQIGEENCLYMNIFKPAAAQLIKFPVLFWVHGGSYESGSGSQFDVDGAIDNFASKGVVLVTINYRLGVLGIRYATLSIRISLTNVNSIGFMSLLNSSLPGNYGLEDQLIALKWVNENIDDFGGDKKSISICGESAGGASVNLLALSPKAQEFKLT